MAVGKKLMFCIAGMLAVIVGLSGAGWYSSESLGSELTFATTKIGMKAILGGELSSELVAVRVSQRGIVMYAMAHDNTLVNQNRDEFRAHVHQAKAKMAAILALSPSVKAKELLASMDSDLDKYTAFFEQMSSLIANGKTAAAVAVARVSAGPIATHMAATAREFGDVQRATLQAANTEGTEKLNSGRYVAWTFTVLGLVVSGMIVVIVRRITSQLRTLTINLSEGASQIASGSSQVSSSAQTLAQGASEQAASLEETSASAEEITAMTRQNASNTAQVAQLMATVDQRVTEGNTTLALMLASMTEITGSSNKISKIIKVIDEIAFQTNILALNAAVEAARAGEAGAGFAVVADEVRNLAQRSAQAAKDTAALIEESISTSNQGSVRLQKVADVVGSITEAANKVKVLVDEVNVGSQEQAKGIEEIGRTLTEMDKVTQANAAASDESASASGHLSAQAQSLAHLVDELRVMVGTAA